MQPDENDYDPQPAINPFDLWKGADFKLKIKQVAGYWNYDDSSFNAASTLGNFDDSKLEEIYNSSYSLEEFTDESNFKSYEQLDERLKAVLGQAVQPKSFETDKYDHAPSITETLFQIQTGRKRLNHSQRLKLLRLQQLLLLKKRRTMR